MGFALKSLASPIYRIMKATTQLPVLSTQYGRALMWSFNPPFVMADGLAGPTSFDASRDEAPLVSGRMR